MKRILNQLLWEATALFFLILLLIDSKNCIRLASEGLLIWYQNMIPTLFPFMILSGFMVLSGLSLKLGLWLKPVMGFLFPLPPQMLYVIFMGYLCGFPMGAKIITDMLKTKQLTLKQSEYLLAFCNNIGPLYMFGYVIPLFPQKNSALFLGAMYLIPLLYGRLLLCFYKPVIRVKPSFQEKHSATFSLSACSVSSITKTDYGDCFRNSLMSAIDSITLLGGCMIFFNCFQALPQYLFRVFSYTKGYNGFVLWEGIFHSLIEIGGGLKQLSSVTSFPQKSAGSFCLLALLTFGGLSCITQTYFILKNTGLKIRTYIKHKLLQSCLFLLIYFAFLLF